MLCHWSLYMRHGQSTSLPHHTSPNPLLSPPNAGLLREAMTSCPLLLSPTRPISKNNPKYFCLPGMASNRRRYRQERVPTRRRYINHVELVLQHLVGQAGHPLLVEGLPIWQIGGHGAPRQRGGQGCHRSGWKHYRSAFRPSNAITASPGAWNDS